jgi:hypothetical protein
MTAQELIHILQQYNPTTRVIIAGYEGGVNDVLKVVPTKILLDQNREWYYGSHERVETSILDPHIDAIDALEII